MGKIEFLTIEKEKRLLILAETGDLEARTKLIKSNLYLITRVMEKLHFRKNEFNDIFNIGIVGLIKSIDSYSLTYGISLSDYCTEYIEREISIYIELINLDYQNLNYQDLINYSDEKISIR